MRLPSNAEGTGLFGRRFESAGLRWLTAVVCVLVGSIGARGQCERGWMGPLSPSVTRQWHGMAYDTARQKVVLFGGWDSTTSGAYNGDTWTWDGVSWSRVSTSGPPPRGVMGMAYDPVRERVVMFGGRTYSGAHTVDLTDTWEWDGAAWTKRADGGPPAPPYPVMAYDAARAQMVLYDGELGWTWAWDGAAWTRLSETGPSRRYGFGLAYDPNDQRVILFGGYMRDLSSGQGDTWAWDGSSWTQVATTGPEPRYEHTMEYDERLGRVLLHGGINDPQVDPVYGDTWTWDGHAWSRLAVPDLTGRVDAAMAYDRARGQMVLVGGRGYDATGLTNQYFGETRVLTQGGWSVAQEPMDPPPRESFAAAYDPVRDRVVVFGGRTTDDVVIGKTYEWDGEHWIKMSPASEPDPGDGYCMAYDAARGVTVMMGGDPGHTWIWDGASWTRLTTPGAPGYRTARMAYDEHRRRVVFFGGAPGLSHETWEWDGATWVQITTGIAPPGRVYHAMAYDPLTQTVMIYGSSTTSLRDTWKWDGATWTKLADGGPTYGYTAMAFDPSSHAMVLYGGTNGVVVSRFSYLWTGTGWAQQPYTLTPNGRGQHQMVTDTRRGRVLMLGGGSSLSPPSSDIWEHSTPETPAVVQQPQGASVMPGGAAVFKVEATGRQLRYRWRHDGLPVFDSGAVRGAETSELRIDPVTTEDGGSYECLVSNGCGTVVSDPATLVAGCAADLNGDGLVDFADYLEFLNLYDASDPTVDFNHDGIVDFGDYLEFLNLFEAGC